MRYFQRILCMAVIIVTTQSVSGDSPSSEPPDVLKHVIDAIGGDAAIRSVKTLHMIWDVDIMSIPGTLEEWYESPDRHYYRLVTPVMAQTECRNGQVEWKQDQNGRITSNPLPAREMNESVIMLFHSVINPGYLEVTSRGMLEKDGKSYDVVEVYDPGEETRHTLYIDPETYLIASEDGQEEGIAATTTYEDYRKVEGILIPFKSVQTVQIAGIPPITFTLKTAEVNLAPPEGIFALPVVAKDFEFDAGKNRAEVAIETAGEHLLVQVRIDGSGPFGFILDSGAGSSIIDNSIVDELNLPVQEGMKAIGIGGVESLGAVSLKTFELDGFKIHGMKVFSANLKPLSEAFGQPVKGIVGYDLFVRMVLKVDYENSLLTILDPDTFEYTGDGTIIPGEINSNLINIRGTIDGRFEGLMRVDTGAAGHIHLHEPFVQQNQILDLYPKSIEIQAMGAGGSQVALLARAASIQIGPYTFPKPPMTIPKNKDTGAMSVGDSIATIGNGIWSQFSVYFDYARNRLILEPNSRFGKPATENRTGCVITRVEDRLEIAAVIPGSPAEKAGLQKGDVLIKVNDLDGEELTPDALKEIFGRKAGTKLKLKFLRDGRKTTRRLVLQDYY